MDFLELAKKQLRLLEMLWLCVMTFGSIALVFVWQNNEANSPLLINYVIPTLFFSLFGLAGVPFLINKALPIWNLWTPWKDRKTIWETECLVFVITIASLTWTSSCFFGIDFGQAATLQICLGLAAFPVLWITARHRWKTHLLEKPKLKGSPDKSALQQNQEYEIRHKKNVTAYSIAAIASTLVQSTAFYICLMLIDKIAVFDFFLSLVIVSLIINLTIPPIGVSLAKQMKYGQSLRPRANFFIGSTLFTIGAIATPYVFKTINALSTSSMHQLKFGTYEITLVIITSTFVLGYLIGALCFERLYKAESQSVNFI